MWIGNDDYTSTKRMTGGTLPAMTWHNIMAYAHQGIELRPLPGLPPPTHAPPLAANATFTGNDAPQQVLLTRKGTDTLVRLERLLDDANHALAAQLPAGTQGALDDDNDAASSTRGDGDRSRRRQATRGDLDQRPTGSNVRLLFGSCFALILAAAIGLGATWLTLTRGVAFGSLTIGAWTAWPKSGRSISIPTRAPPSRAPANCRSAPATALRSTPAPTMPEIISTAAAPSSSAA